MRGQTSLRAQVCHTAGERGNRRKARDRMIPGIGIKSGADRESRDAPDEQRVAIRIGACRSLTGTMNSAAAGVLRMQAEKLNCDGLVPKQNSSGRQGERGDRYLPGALAVIRYAKIHGMRHRPWQQRVCY